MRLEAARQQLDAWKAPPEGSWKQFGASKTYPIEVLESSWELTELAWRLLEGLGGVMGGLGGVVGDAGAALEAYKRRLGGSLGRLGIVLGALEAMLQPSGDQKAPKMEPQKGPDSSSRGDSN